MAKEITSSVREKNTEGGEPVQDSLWMRPSTRAMRRSAEVAMV